MIRCFLLFILFSTSLSVDAQLDSCGNDYRPISTLNKYEVEFLNAYLDDKPFELTENTKVGYVEGAGPLISTKCEFFKQVKHWSKSELKLKMVALNSEEKQKGGDYDVLMVYFTDEFEGENRVETIESLSKGKIDFPWQVCYSPLDNPYVGVLYYINEDFNDSVVKVEQKEDRIIVSPKNNSCFSIAYDFADLDEFDEHEKCYKITYKTTCDACNKSMLNSALNLRYWTSIDTNNYVSRYGMGINTPKGSKKVKEALIYRLSVTHNDDDTILIEIVMDEMDWKEWRALWKESE